MAVPFSAEMALRQIRLETTVISISMIPLVRYTDQSRTIPGLLPAYHWLVRRVSAGVNGTDGTNGTTILNGTGAPASTTGNNGDFYLDTASTVLYGPKTNGAWPGAGVSLTGTAGTNGQNGNTILNGAGAPLNTSGNNGDFYLHTIAIVLYGPKAAGIWPASGTSLIGSNSIVDVINAGTLNAASNTSYIAAATTGVANFVLPMDPTIGDTVEVKGFGVPGWTVTPNTLQSIDFTSLPILGVSTFSVWNQVYQSPTSAVTSIASDATGSNLAATVANDHIYLTHNGGQTWTTASAPFGSWLSVASSADGTKLAAVAFSGFIYTSADSGTTWVNNSPVTTNNPWKAIASDTSGSYLVACENGGLIYVSSNGGATWTQPADLSSAMQWYSVAENASGRIMIAAAYSNGIYVSTDYGQTWTQTNLQAEQWSSVAASADGQTLVATSTTNSTQLQGTGSLYISADAGITWTKTSAGANDSVNNPLAGSWISAAVDSTGGFIIAASGDPAGQVYASRDAGISWSVTSAPINYNRSVAMSPNGAHLMLAQLSSIYTTSTQGGIYGSEHDAVDLQYLGNGIWGFLSAFGNDFENY